MSTNSTSEPRELTETPDLNGAYPRLDEAGIAALAPLGRRRRVQPEEILFREGDRDCQFFVVLAGMAASVEGYGTAEENVISVHGRGRFLGELSLLTGEGSYYTAVAAEEGEVLAVPVGRLRELVACDQGIGDLILRAYLIRRSILIGLGAGLRIIGSRYSPDARRVRDFAARNRLPYRWLDLDGDPGAEALLARFGVAPQDTPIPNVRVMLGTEVREPLGDQALEAVAVADGRTGGRSVLPARALFVFIGVRPCTGWLGGLVDLDDRGFVRTGQDTGSSALETSRPGIFAVGDVRSGSAKRVATAVGEGAMAIRLAFERTRPG